MKYLKFTSPKQNGTVMVAKVLLASGHAHQNIDVVRGELRDGDGALVTPYMSLVLYPDGKHKKAPYRWKLLFVLNDPLKDGMKYKLGAFGKDLEHKLDYEADPIWVTARAVKGPTIASHNNNDNITD